MSDRPVDFPGSTRNHWVNTLLGKEVRIHTGFCGAMSAQPFSIDGKFIGVEKLEYRLSVVIEQNNQPVHINIDHIFSIEEA